MNAPMAPSVGISARSVLSVDDITCSVFTLAPGQHTSCLDPHSNRDHILFVVEGKVTIAMEDLTFVVEESGALHIPAFRPHTITADASMWAKLLRIDFAPRHVDEPVLTTLYPT